MPTKSSSKMSRQEAGRKGAEARWGQQKTTQKQGSRSAQHQKTTRAGAAARGNKSHDRNEGDRTFSGGRRGSNFQSHHQYEPEFDQRPRGYGRGQEEYTRCEHCGSRIQSNSGHAGMNTRSGRSYNGGYGSREDDRRSGSYAQHQQAGRTGANTGWGREERNGKEEYAYQGQGQGRRGQEGNGRRGRNTPSSYQKTNSKSGQSRRGNK